MRDIILAHDPIILGVALAVGIGGTALATSMLRTALSHARAHRFHWLAIAAVILGANMWSMSFLMQLSHFGWASTRVDSTAAVGAAVVAVLVSFAALRLRMSKKSLVMTSLGRLMCGASLPALVLLNMTAFSTIIVPVPFMIFLLISLIAFCTSVIGWMEDQGYAAIAHGGVERDTIATVIMLAICHFSILMLFESASVRAFPPADYISHVFPIVVAMLLLAMVGSSAGHADRSRSAEQVEKYRQLALHDSLTNLPNRLNMQQSLDTWVAERTSNGRPIGVFVIDLDRFKDVNDVHGHAAGDALLKGLAQHLTKDLGSDEFLYRTGGDEFVAVKLDVGSREGAEHFANRLCGLVNGFDSWMTGDARIGATIGGCLFPVDGKSSGEILSRADLAMYRAKAMGRGQVCMFDMFMDEARRAKKALSMDLHRAIRDNELEIHWQPQVDARNGSLIGFEALLRWDHPERGSVSPAEFIPLAEQTGQILDIGAWVMQNACNEAASWKRPHRISVNVAAGQVNQCDLPSLVRTALERSGLPAQRLELEITETGIIRDVNRAYETVWKIKEMGVGLAMDDFGTGHSSLSTLQAFPFDKIKIDRAFIAEIGKSASADAIVQATTQIAHAMGMRVLAEGVEELEQIEALTRIGCHEMQGFYFNRPLNAADARKFYGLMDSDLEQFEADRVADSIGRGQHSGIG